RKAEQERLAEEAAAKSPPPDPFRQGAAGRRELGQPPARLEIGGEGIKPPSVKPPSVKPPSARPPTWLGGSARPPTRVSDSGEPAAAPPGPPARLPIEPVAPIASKPGPEPEAPRPQAIAPAPETIPEPEPVTPPLSLETESHHEESLEIQTPDSGDPDASSSLERKASRYESKLGSKSGSAERRSRSRSAEGAKPQGLKSKSLKGKAPPPPPPPPPLPPEPELTSEDEAPVPSAVNWKVGDVLDGKFEVKELVGGGGMGTVFRVRHWEWNVDLAVKAPLPNLVADWADKERLILEAHTWVDLGVHPNIVQCWFVREYDGVPLLFLDYLPGGSLRDVMVSGKVRPGQWDKILDLAIQACDGLAHAHDHGLIHRDVKPANMLIGEDGQLCVTDFGLVKVKKDEPGTGDIAFDAARLQQVQAEGDLSLTATGTVMGTPHYAAPEQWLGQNVGVQADVYAMGILLFEMCCGFRPFDLADSTMSITHLVTCHVYQPPPPPPPPTPPRARCPGPACSGPRP
ncbi:hypothetical protein DYH09_31545, partial [bacterium CPR1]|nr:hypothetical protein [bacterium CPR1]